MSRPILVVEIDIPACSLTYGTAPCTAALGVTGDIKCFNTSRTCQDKPNFSRGVLTLRFSEPFAEMAFDAYPALSTVNVTPNVINPGRDMGVRAQVSIAIDDFQSADVGGLDKYLSSRTYDPFSQGTFWGKFRARIPSMEGFPCRVLRGDVDQELSAYTVEHYIITSAVMDASGVSIQAKDFLALCDTKKAQAPNISNGRLLAAIETTAATTITLTPTGIGDEEYPAAGKVCLSGKEICSFTRTGDDLFITREQDGTVAQEHDADSIVQLVLEFTSEGADDIIRTLLEDYTPGFDTAWIDDAEWQTEIDTYVGILYSAVIPAPTSVATLINEVITQAGLAMWVDVEEERVRLISLRPVVPDANLYDDDLYSAGSLSVKENPDKRVSQAWTYYGVADATNKLDKESNFRAGVVTVGAETELDYTLPSITKTFSRWIPVTARNAAERLNDMLLARFQDGPRTLVMDFLPTISQLPKLGTGIRVGASVFQDATGAEAAVPFFVTSVERSPERISVEAEEAQFFSGSVPGRERSIFIEVDTFNVTLRELYDSLYSGIPDDMILSVYVTSTAYVGSIDPGSPSLWIKDDFPEDSTIKLYVATGGGIAGAGGKGSGYEPGFDVGQAGGTALKVERPVEVINTGLIAGGGGGGGRIIGSGTSGFSFTSAGGGGGAGFNSKELVDGVLLRLGGYGGAFADATVSPPPRTGAYQRGKAPLLAAGSYGGQGARAEIPGGVLEAGDGGEPGSAGEAAYAPAGYSASAPGAAGKAVEGDSFITWTSMGTIFGART